jgi:hypothetical protein
MEQDFEEQFEELWKINSDGNKRTTYDAVKIIINKEYLDFNHVPYTIKTIAESYQEYMSYWTASFGQTEPRYVSNQNKLKTIYEFINTLSFQKTWKIPDSNRMGYLFGGLSKKYLDKRYEEYLKLIKKRK